MAEVLFGTDDRNQDRAQRIRDGLAQGSDWAYGAVEAEDGVFALYIAALENPDLPVDAATLEMALTLIAGKADNWKSWAQETAGRLFD